MSDQKNLMHFLNVDYGVVGRTVSTKMEPNTSSQFQFWLANRGQSRQSNGKEPQTETASRESDGKETQTEVVSPESDEKETQTEIASLEIGNIVAAHTDDENDITFGLVVEMRSYSDVDSFIADYLSHNFGDAEIEVPTDISEVIVVTCSVMRNISGKTKPVGRSRIYFPSVLGIQFAYGIVDEQGKLLYRGAAIPMGVFQNGDDTVAPISVDEDFLLGPEGAHLNVSGISGLASKTSAVQFAIKSLLTHAQKRVAVVMFNVKSKDLLYIDRPNPKLEEDRPTPKLENEEWSRQVYQALEIPIEPFSNARFFAPADLENNPNGTQSLRRLPTQRFEWNLSMIYEDIPTLFDPLDWDDKMEGVWYIIQEQIEQGNLHTYAQMLAWVNGQINQANNARPPQQWIRGNHIATWNKMRSHLQRFPSTFSGLITPAGQGQDIPWNELNNGSVYVIDIQMLNDRGQRLVFGRSISTLSQKLEEEEYELDAIIVFVDELNKFAPSGNIRSPLKASLIDITARGRSLGMVLFGAEQFSSSVDKEVIENSSTYLFGRTETNELRTPTFSAFSNEVKTKLTMLPQGQLLIKFAKFPQPIFLRFPYPPCIPGNEFDPDVHNQSDFG